MKPKSILLILAVSVSGLACAETMERERGAAGTAPADRSVTTFEEVDRDNSGYVEMEEAVATGLGTADFASFDSNNDGRLTPQEFEAAYASVPGRQEAIEKK